MKPSASFNAAHAVRDHDRVKPARRPFGVRRLCGRRRAAGSLYNRRNNPVEWVDILTNIGVPIGCMAALAAYVLKRDKRDEDRERQHAATIDNLIAEHKAEIAELQSANGAKMDKLTEVINNNTVALTQLSERIGGVINGNVPLVP